MKKTNGRKRPHDVAPDVYVISVRLRMPVLDRLRAQAKVEGRPMANLAAVFIQAGLDDRQRGGRI
jgi:hypothetical protein